MKSKVWLFKSDESSRTTDYQKELFDKGFEVEIIPTLSFSFTNGEILLEAINNPDKHSGIVFTSMRGVEAFSNVYSKIPIEIHTEWNSKPVFVVGQSTADKVREKLSLSSIGKETGNANQLIPVILQNTKSFDKPLLFPCGNLQSKDLLLSLASNDRDFRAITSYITNQHPELNSTIKKLSLQTKPDFLVFFSPSGVNYTVALFKNLGISNFFTGIKVLAIGPSTNSALVNNDIPVAGVCSEPTPNGILKLLS